MSIIIHQKKREGVSQKKIRLQHASLTGMPWIRTVKVRDYSQECKK